MSNLTKIDSIVKKITKGQYGSSDVGVLLVWLRPYLSAEPKLLDLSNFITHSEGRDRGASFEYIESFANNFIKISEQGGIIGNLNPVFTRDEIIQDLMRMLNNLKIEFSESSFLIQRDKIVESIEDMIDDTEIKCSDKRITRCFIKRFDRRMLFCLSLDLPGPIIRTSPHAIISSILFD